MYYDLANENPRLLKILCLFMLCCAEPKVHQKDLKSIFILQCYYFGKSTKAETFINLKVLVHLMLVVCFICM